MFLGPQKLILEEIPFISFNIYDETRFFVTYYTFVVTYLVSFRICKE